MDEPLDIEEVIAGWTPGQRRCRAAGRHRWNGYSVVLHRSVNGAYYEVTERCPDCLNRHYRLMDMQGYWLTRWRAERYGPGYLLPKGSGRLDDDQRARIRLAEVTSRTIKEVDDDA